MEPTITEFGEPAGDEALARNLEAQQVQAQAQEVQAQVGRDAALAREMQLEGQGSVEAAGGGDGAAQLTAGDPDAKEQAAAAAKAEAERKAAEQREQAERERQRKQARDAELKARDAELKEREKVVEDLMQRKTAYGQKLEAEREAEDHLQRCKANLEKERQNAEVATSKRDTETPKAQEQLSKAESILERVKELLAWATVDKKEDLDTLIKTLELRALWLEGEISDITAELKRRKEEAFQDTLSKLGDAGYLFCVLKFLETALESTTMAILTISVLFEPSFGADAGRRLAEGDEQRSTQSLFVSSFILSVLSMAYGLYGMVPRKEGLKSFTAPAMQLVLCFAVQLAWAFVAIGVWTGSTGLWSEMWQLRIACLQNDYNWDPQLAMCLEVLPPPPPPLAHTLDPSGCTDVCLIPRPPRTRDIEGHLYSKNKTLNFLTK